MYKYEDLKKQLLSDGIRYLISTTIFISKRKENTFFMEDAINYVLGDSWMVMAAIDYLKEQEFIREIEKSGYVAGQNREFIINI